MTVKRAASIAGIGVSTARMIVKKFERNKTIYSPKKTQTQDEKVEKV